MGNTGSSRRKVHARIREKDVSGAQTTVRKVKEVQEVVTFPQETNTESKIVGVLYLKVLETRLFTEKGKLTYVKGISGTGNAPFVVISVEDKQYETRVVEKENAVWNQQYHILIHSKTMDEPITFELMNMPSFARVIRLGSLNILVKDLVKDFEEHDVWLDVSYKIPKRKRQWGFRKPSITIAELHLNFQLKPMEEVNKQFWCGLAKQYDFDHNGLIDSFELGCMLQAIGSTLSDSDISDLFKSQTDDIPISELPNIMSRAKTNHLVRAVKCPVCGRSVVEARRGLAESGTLVSHASVQPHCVENIIKCREDAEVIAHVAPCMEYSAEDLLVRNFLFDIVGISWWKEALPEWTNHSQFIRDDGNIIVWDRKTKSQRAEKVPVFQKMGLRAMYSAFPRNLDNAKQFLAKLTKVVAPKYNDPSTRRYITQFIHFYGISMDDVRDPISSFHNFNEFIIRDFKPHARPIADVRNQHIAVIPADSRVLVFEDINSSTKLWIKGEQFNLQNLLQDDKLAMKFLRGSIAIFRMSPEDIHRFSVPIACTVKKTKLIKGEYFIDHPVSIRENVDVLTTNVRTITELDAPGFGHVLYICVGSGMLGSIVITAKEGQILKKGDELGYFQFGGSTVILLFEEGKILYADDLLQNSAKPMETYSWLGSPLGVLPKA